VLTQVRKEGDFQEKPKTILPMMVDWVLGDLIFNAVVVKAVDEVLNGNDFLGIFV